MSDTESSQLWDDEEDDLQGGQAFSDALASLGTHLQEQQHENMFPEDETEADAKMYEEGVSYETEINQNGEPAEVSYSDLTEEDAFTMNDATQANQDTELSLDDELDNLIPDEPVAMSASGDMELSLDDELDNLIPDEPVAMSASGDMELSLDDELDNLIPDEPVYAESAYAEAEHSEGEISLGAELDAILNVSSPAEEAEEVEEAVEDVYEEPVVEVSFEDELPVEEESAPAESYVDDSHADESYAEVSDEAPAAADDEGYLAEEEPAAADFAAYPSYEESEEEMETYDLIEDAVDEVVDAAPEPVHAHEDSPMAAMVAGHDGADDFNLATLTQLVDEIRQESDRVAEMKESVARALALIQEMSESLKS